MDPQRAHEKGNTSRMAYSHCRTRIIDLKEFDIPESVTQNEYRQIYDTLSKSQAPSARLLTDAVNSIYIGIAPPIAFPTETVYGLGADATNPASIAGIFAAKGRPSDNPLIVHVASREHLEYLTGESIPEVYHELVKEHWPGPLTILIPVPVKNSIFATNVHPGQRTIGFRVPSSKYARFFIAATDRPLAAPSANSSGKPSPTTAQHVMDDMKGKINYILDGGFCDVGVESTVVDGLHDPPLILRPGGLSQDELIAHGRRHGSIWANVQIGYKSRSTSHDGEQGDGKLASDKKEQADEAPRAPGMKYKHYAPRGKMILFEGDDLVQDILARLDTLVNSHEMLSLNGTSKSINIAILTTTSWQNQPTKTSASTSNTSVLASTPDRNSPDTPLSPSNPESIHTDPPALPPTLDNHKIHTLHLGTTPTQIAQSLFAALRTCDDLGCQIILAESPRIPSRFSVEVVNGGAHGEDDDGGDRQIHQFDAVLERMRKAASLIVR